MNRSTATTLAVAFLNSIHEIQATHLADELELPMADVQSQNFDCLLVFTDTHLELRSTKPKPPGPIYVDFLSGTLAHRRLYGGGKGQLIARAVGFKNKPNPTVLDISAGLGRDSFVLATVGAEVTMLERNPIIHALLKDGLERANAAEWFRQLKLTLLKSEASDYLKSLSIKPDVIYFDPMYPDRKQTALAKKEMRMLRKLAGTDEDAATTLAFALHHAKHRVVVKRPRHSKSIEGQKPSLVFNGKSSRFDVYLT